MSYYQAAKTKSLMSRMLVSPGSAGTSTFACAIPKGEASTASLHEGTIGEVAATGKVANLKDASMESFPGEPEYEMKTMLAMSVCDSSGECIAVVQAANKLFGKVRCSNIMRALNLTRR
jgi:hypothetical protein